MPSQLSTLRKLPLGGSVVLKESLQTLSTNPTHCPLAPENDLVAQTIYQFLFGKRTARYRVLFTIEDNRVLILHIRRGTMDTAAESDLCG